MMVLLERNWLLQISADICACLSEVEFLSLLIRPHCSLDGKKVRRGTEKSVRCRVKERKNAEKKSCKQAVFLSRWRWRNLDTTLATRVASTTSVPLPNTKLSLLVRSFFIAQRNSIQYPNMPPPLSSGSHLFSLVFVRITIKLCHLGGVHNISVIHV